MLSHDALDDIQSDMATCITLGCRCQRSEGGRAACEGASQGKLSDRRKLGSVIRGPRAAFSSRSARDLALLLLQCIRMSLHLVSSLEIAVRTPDTAMPRQISPNSPLIFPFWGSPERDGSQNKNRVHPHCRCACS